MKKHDPMLLAADIDLVGKLIITTIPIADYAAMTAIRAGLSAYTYYQGLAYDVENMSETD